MDAGEPSPISVESQGIRADQQEPHRGRGAYMEELISSVQRLRGWAHGNGPIHWDALNHDVVFGATGMVLTVAGMFVALWLWRSVKRDVSALRDVVVDHIIAPEASWMRTRNATFLRLTLPKEMQDRWGLTTMRTADHGLRLRSVAVGMGGELELAATSGPEIDAHLAPSVDFLLLDRSDNISAGALVVTVESLSRKILSKKFVFQIREAPSMAEEKQDRETTGNQEMAGTAAG
jgi:hypothetical protein